MNDKLKDKKYFIELLLIAVTLAWGISFIWSKQAMMSGISTDAFLTMRYMISGLVLLPFCLKEMKSATKKQVMKGVFIGVLLYFGMYLQTEGLKYTTPSNSAFITTAYVVMVPFCEWAFFKRRPKAKVYFSTILCVAGIYFLTMTPGEPLTLNLGNALTLVCAVMWALQVTYLSYAAKDVPLKLLTILPILTVGTISLMMCLIRGDVATSFSGVSSVLLPIVCCALIPTVFANTAQTYAQKYINPSKASIIYTLESVFATIFSLILGYEDVRIGLLFGGALITGGILVSQDIGAKKGAALDNLAENGQITKSEVEEKG